MGFFRNRKEQDDKNNYAYHSSSYHDYFEGYSEERLPKENGKGSRIVRTYTGVYFEADLPGNGWLIQKICIAVFYILGAAALSLYSLMRPLEITFFLRLTESLSFLSLFILLYYLILYLSTPKTMTAGSYHTSAQRFVLPCLICACILSCHSVGYGVSLFFLAPESPLKAGFALVFALLSAGFIFISWILEKRTAYRRINSQQTAGIDSVEL